MPDPAAGVQRPAPRAHLGAVEARLAAAMAAELVGQVGVEPRANLLAEARLLGRVAEVHGAMLEPRARRFHAGRVTTPQHRPRRVRSTIGRRARRPPAARIRRRREEHTCPHRKASPSSRRATARRRRRPSATSNAPRALLEEALVEVKRVIAGQDEMLERVLVCLVAGGHLLIEGVPGLAKTLTIKTTAAVLGGSFRRIQFTPDLVPSDLVGTRIYRPDQGTFETDLGPVFCNFLLADEINRAPAKVQSALLEVMQEHQVTIGHDTHIVPAPFLVMATQNPIESEGTYPASRGAGRPVHAQGARRIPRARRGAHRRPPLARGARRRAAGPPALRALRAADGP